MCSESKGKEQRRVIRCNMWKVYGRLKERYIYEACMVVVGGVGWVDSSIIGVEQLLSAATRSGRGRRTKPPGARWRTLPPGRRRRPPSRAAAAQYGRGRG